MTCFLREKRYAWVKAAAAAVLLLVSCGQGFAQAPKPPVATIQKAAAAKPAAAPHRIVYRHYKRRYYSRYRHRRVTAPTALLDRTGNLVEPLSNGLAFTMPRSAVQERFGKPQKAVGTQLRYAEFGVEYLKGKDRMIFVALQGNVRLNCGLGTGATRPQVEKTFGKLDSRSNVVYKKFLLHFSPGPGGIIEAITVSPASGQVSRLEVQSFD